MSIFSENLPLIEGMESDLFELEKEAERLRKTIERQRLAIDRVKMGALGLAQPELPFISTTGSASITITVFDSPPFPLNPFTR